MTEAIPTEGDGVLAGMRVLDLTHALSGAYATRLLADLGADVIKVERPGGEPLRALEVDGLEPFEVLNRNKRSVVVDLRHEEGPALLRSLLPTVDVLVENFRPGVLARFGLDYAGVEEDCPHLVYCSISGFGRDGRYAERRGFDLAAQAMSGLMTLTAEPGHPPQRAGAPVASVAAGMLAATGIVAAYARRLVTGRGRHVTTSLLDAARTLTLLDAPRAGDIGRPGPLVALEDVFRTSDGWIVVSAGDDDGWRALCDRLDRADLREDARFATGARRRANHAELRAVLEHAFEAEGTLHWTELLHAAGVGCAPVRAPDPRPAVPVQTGSGPAPAGAVPPAGGDTRDVLVELGVPPARLDELLERAVVREPDAPARTPRTAPRREHSDARA